MKEFSYTIKDPLGIHARPAGLLVKKLEGFPGTVSITRGDDTCDGKKLLAVMKLRVKAGQTITLRFEGSGEEEAAAAALAYLTEIL